MTALLWPESLRPFAVERARAALAEFDAGRAGGQQPPLMWYAEMAGLLSECLRRFTDTEDTP